ncbi:MAG: DUF4919 domain-containing protein [Polyangiaceae bacterium]|nr:DUF4919 domain-containing protein [Polyangiaceae bacterium]
MRTTPEAGMLGRVVRRGVTVAGLLAAVGGCGTSNAEAPPARAPDDAQPPPNGAFQRASDSVPPRPAFAAADAAYYRSRATALQTESAAEIAQTDFLRMLRGRLYARGAFEPDSVQSLHDRLTRAFAGSDTSTVLDVTARLLAEDQADIRAHMLRAVTLRKLGSSALADFHAGVAIGIVRSIMGTGDGRGFESAWTVYRVPEEYEVLKFLECTPVSQSLELGGDRVFDVLVARRVDGGEEIQVYFDISELFAEEHRALGRTLGTH